MNAQNSAKLLNAGLRVFRINIPNKTITECAGFGKWKKYGAYKTKAELMHVWNELMKCPKYIGD